MPVDLAVCRDACACHVVTFHHLHRHRHHYHLPHHHQYHAYSHVLFMLSILMSSPICALGPPNFQRIGTSSRCSWPCRLSGSRLTCQPLALQVRGECGKWDSRPTCLRPNASRALPPCDVRWQFFGGLPRWTRTNYETKITWACMESTPVSLRSAGEASGQYSYALACRNMEDFPARTGQRKQTTCGYGVFIMDAMTTSDSQQASVGLDGPKSMFV